MSCPCCGAGRHHHRTDCPLLENTDASDRWASDYGEYLAGDD